MGDEQMAYVALYRKWRPTTFDEVVEQEAVVSILKNTVMTQRIAHAYLFCGTRGTGKTTLAKIFARAINCLHPVEGNPCNECEICKGILSQQLLDVSEIDAASNNGVDNIRAIIEESAYSAARAKYRVYIIDEVHMLSTGAFNALLKTLEEPPAGVVFILATTEPHKLPITILSRCQRYDFKRISREGIVNRLEEICQSLDLEYETNALQFLAQKADGALRDAISLLDQTIAACGNRLTIQAARDAAGSLSRESLEAFVRSLLASDGPAILQQTDALFAEGRDPSNFIAEVMSLLRSLLVVLTVRNPGTMLYESGEELERLREMAKSTNTTELSLLIRELSRLDNNLKWAVQRKILFEAGMLELCDRHWNEGEVDWQNRLRYLEERVADLVASGMKIAARGDTARIQQAESATSAREVSWQANQEGKEASQALPTASATPEGAEDKTSTKGSKATPAEELDWKDFLANVSRIKPANAALLGTGCKGFILEPGELLLAFHNKMMWDMIQKSDCLPLLEEAATSAFGRPLHIRLILQSELEENSNLRPKEDSSKADSFDETLARLSKLADEEGFPVHME